MTQLGGVGPVGHRGFLSTRSRPEYRRVLRTIWEELEAFCRSMSLPALGESGSCYRSANRVLVAFIQSEFEAENLRILPSTPFWAHKLFADT